jgi:hypothetical protein
MALNDFKPQFDNAYQEIFQKVLVAKSIANMRFEPTLKFGESVERVAYDISGVQVRSVSRGSASTIDAITDTSELLNINLEKEAVFHISDGEVKQAGPLNPGEVIGGQIAIKVATDFDSRVLYEVKSATQAFDNGDLTTLASDGTPITLSSTTVPQIAARCPAKLRRANQTLTNLCFVLDSYAASDFTQYLLGKNIDLAGSVYANGYTGDVSNAQVYVSENLTGEAVLLTTGVFVDTQTVTINGIVFTSVAAIGSTPGNFLIGGSVATSLTNLAGLINDPSSTNANQVALSAANQVLITDTYKLAATATATDLTIVGTGSGALTLAETQTNASWSKNFIHAYFGKKGGIDAVLQDIKEVDMRPTADRRGTNVFTSYLGGIKTIADGAKKFLDVKIAR